MQNLFGEEERKPIQSMKIIAKGKKILSKNQLLFNKFSKRIETLEKEIPRQKEKLDRILEFHSKELIPLQQEIAQKKITVSMILGTATRMHTFGKKHADIIQDIILDFCDDAFGIVEPTKEQETFYDSWSDVSYKDDVEFEKDLSKDFLTLQMKEMGLDIDLSDIDDTPAGMAKLQEKIKNEMNQLDQKTRNRPGKKSKKQRLLEQEQITEEEMKNKSIRNIYIALVKVLHPDVENDSAVQKEKEEIMKKVTAAYNAKDLLTLLKLEMQWVQKEMAQLDSIAEEKLELHNIALQQQVDTLEEEKILVGMHPRYISIGDYSMMREEAAIHSIQAEVNKLKDVQEEFTMMINDFEKPNGKKYIVTFLNDYYDSLSSNEFLDLLDRW